MFSRTVANLIPSSHIGPAPTHQDFLTQLLDELTASDEIVLI
jgi:hypothetical protein